MDSGLVVPLQGKVLQRDRGTSGKKCHPVCWWEATLHNNVLMLPPGRRFGQKQSSGKRR